MEEDKMHLYILRHGQTDYNLMGKFQGQIDIGLNEKGIEQAKKVAQEFSVIQFNKVFSSPLRRAIQTAEFATETNIIIDNRITERSFGLLEGKESIADYEEKIVEYQIETIENLQQRVYDFLDEILNRCQQNDNILIATHACVARMIECYFSKRNYREVQKYYELSNGQYKKYVVGDVHK
jgi:broad specificity phosphatase PhoE